MSASHWILTLSYKYPPKARSSPLMSLYGSIENSITTLFSRVCAKGPKTLEINFFHITDFLSARLNVLMDGEASKESSSSKSLNYEAPLGYGIEYVRPHGGIKKFRSAAYSNCARKPS